MGNIYAPIIFGTNRYTLSVILRRDLLVKMDKEFKNFQFPVFNSEQMMILISVVKKKNV